MKKTKKSKVVVIARESGYTDAKKDVGMFDSKTTLAGVLRWARSLPFTPQSIEVRSEGG